MQTKKPKKKSSSVAFIKYKKEKKTIQWMHTKSMIYSTFNKNTVSSKFKAKV